MKLNYQIAGSTAHIRVVRTPGAVVGSKNENASVLLQDLVSQSFKGNEAFLLVRHHISEDILLNTILKYQYISPEVAGSRENETPSVDRGLKNWMVLSANW